MTRRLAAALSSDKQRVRTYGAGTARRLHSRLSQLLDADNLGTMLSLSGACHELHQNRAGQLGLNVTGNLRLIFKPTVDPPPEKPDGGLDWTSVSAITILEVTDYHGR